MQGARKTVIFWPDYTASNPYQTLLYHKIARDHDVSGGTVDRAIDAIGRSDAPGNVVCHIHWLNKLFPATIPPEDAQARFEALFAKLQQFVEAGGRLVWTIHNVNTHDSAFAPLEHAASARLAQLAHRLHLHAEASVAEVAKAFPLPAEKLRISRHGNYIASYPDMMDQSAAREALGIAEDDDVIVFVGRVRRYKGVDILIEAFRNILPDRPKARLIIAGKTISYAPFDHLDLSPDEAQRVDLRDEFVDDAQMPVLFGAADVAAFPYRGVLTSGSLMLALSFGVPTVVTRSGMTGELLDRHDVGRLYDGDAGVSGLERALRDLLQAKDEGRLGRIAANARTLAEAMDWPYFAPAVED